MTYGAQSSNVTLQWLITQLIQCVWFFSEIRTSADRDKKIIKLFTVLAKEFLKLHIDSRKNGARLGIVEIISDEPSD